MSERVNRSRRGRRGYTLVEVMSAMTLFAIGAAGVIGMQRVTIQGGEDARNFDMATNIAREWQHRLQRDSLLWTQPDSIVSTSNISNTHWISAGVNAENTWLTPTYVGDDSNIDGYAHAFDVHGRDVADTDTDKMFCVQYRLGWIAPGGEDTPNITAIIRAEIRVYWARLEFEPANCANPPVPNQHHVVSLATALRENPLR